jgi:anti-sigma regulatory factor (Ser/Thr protein kinase)
MQAVRIQDPADVLIAQQVARRTARALGFARPASAELAIVASELASNILKYGKKGVLRIERVSHPAHGAGVRMIAEDEGPPFKNFERAQIDGFSDDGPLELTAYLGRKGTASGLGAVRRLTHELSWKQLANGKAVIATRYVRLAKKIA